MRYVITVIDNGELKSIYKNEIDALDHPYLPEALENAMNRVLDMRSAPLRELGDDDEQRVDDLLTRCLGTPGGTTMSQRVADDTEHANRRQR